MKRYLFLIILIFVNSCVFSYSEPKTEEGFLINKISTLLRRHFAYDEIKRKYPERFFEVYLETLDGTKRFFIKSDIDELKKQLKDFDSNLKEENFSFFHKSTNILINRIIETSNIIIEILDKPLDFSIDEEVVLDPKKREYPIDLNDKKDLWRKLLKNEVLNKIIVKLDAQKRKEYTKEDEEIARNEVKRETLKMIERRLNDKNYFNRFVNSIVSSFDNHTEYFPPSEKEDFDINMTGSFEGIGAQLREDGEYIKVQEIIPGGPAAKQKLLKAGDIILKVGQGNSTPIDVVNMPVNEVVRLIRGKAGTEVRLTVKKPDGQIVIIPIIRGKVVLEDSYAKVSILKDGGKKFGYIYLPSFYRDFKGKEQRNSSIDMIYALEAISKEGVNGLIIDLRNNGGGSLMDAINISGLFFKSGPVVQVKHSIGFVQTLSDQDPEIYYDGPIVILVNEMSASASEIFAAALQDYGRAIVVGSRKTFGKGTVQNLIDLGIYVSEEGKNTNYLGALKITEQKFYRINGDSTQKKGVIPDIILPSIYGYIEFGEDSFKFPLEFDTIRSAQYEKWSKMYNIKELKERSSNRIEKNPTFQYIDKTVKLIKERNEKPFPLKFEKALEFYSGIKGLSENLSKEQTNSTKINAEWIDYRNIGEDEDSKIKHNDWVNQISRDIYIKEGIEILKDIENIE
ncbi:MAG: carboxy terminal-processing peptidase [Brevinematales bacterium]|nr:carboxy terminal-processing peptidase [Brevinematales bacterium]